MKLRMHRGGLAESMATVVEIEPTKEALLEEVRKQTEPFMLKDIPEAALSVMPYGFDNRTNWDTHIVEIKGFGMIGYWVYGFTDGPLVTS